MKRQPRWDIDSIHAQERNLGVVAVIGAYADIIIVIAICAGVIKGAQTRVEIMNAYELAIDGLRRRPQPGPVQLQPVLESHPGATQTLVRICTLKTNTY